MIDSSGGHIESDISNTDIFVNIYIVSKQMRKYRYFDIEKKKKNTHKKTHKKTHTQIKKGLFK